MGSKEYKLTAFKVNGFLGSQVSILGLLLFKIYLADLPLIIDDIDIANYADNKTSHVTADDIEGVIASLENGLGRIYLNLMPRNATYQLTFRKGWSSFHTQQKS